MNNYLIPIRDNIPAWYELSLLKDGRGIVISIFKEVMDEIKGIITNNSPTVKLFEKEFNPPFPLFEILPPYFIPPTEDNWGFGEVLVKVDDERKNWVSYKINFPIIKGSDKECDKNNAKEINRTLYVLFVKLSLDEVIRKSSNNKLQLLTVTVVAEDDILNSGSLSVVMTPAMRKWLNISPIGHSYDDVAQVMKDAYTYMWQDDLGSSEYCFKAELLQSGGISLNIPGNACDLSPGDINKNYPEDGYELLPHNIDNYLQLFTFLAGLAKMHELARQDGF